MRIVYDPEADALTITLRETTVTTERLTERIAADYDADGRLVGIEILDALKGLGGSAVLNEITLQGISSTIQPATHTFEGR